jgi:hypothetical protein
MLTKSGVHLVATSVNKLLHSEQQRITLVMDGSSTMGYICRQGIRIKIHDLVMIHTIGQDQSNVNT